MPALEARLQGLLTQIHERTHVPGLSVAVTLDGVRVHASVGTTSSDNSVELSPQSRFQSGCITKMVTCLVVLELARRQTLSLDAPMADYLPEIEDVPKARSITLRDLASHTSGYQGLNLANTESAYFYSWDKFVTFFRNTPQTFLPGTVFNYEHSECVALGEIVRRVTRSSPDRIARDLIFDPLGVTLGAVQTDASDPKAHVLNHAFDPASGRYKPLRAVPYCDFWADSLSSATISPSDLALLGEVLAGVTVSRLETDTIAEAQRTVIRIPAHIGGPRKEQMPVSFGFGCGQYSGQLLGHNGSARGQTCGIRFDPARRMVIVVALNAWQPYLRDLILNTVADQIRPAGTVPEAASGTVSEEWMLEEWQGSYTGCLQGVSLATRMEDGRLICTLTNQSTRTIAAMTLSRSDSGLLTLHSDAPHLSIGLFREASSGSPCMSVGLNAFRKIP